MITIESLNWNKIQESLAEKGYAHIPAVLSIEECNKLAAYYTQEDLYRSVINMQRYRFGKGEYKYFQYPLPPAIPPAASRPA